jgi:signal transduction histidine kinase
MRFTNSGGGITVRIAQSAAGVDVSVRDSGAGIPASDLPHIFERFYRANHDSRDSRDADGGTGLGLAITKRILDLHDSRIEATSRIGYGTQFTFALPASDSLTPNLHV